MGVIVGLGSVITFFLSADAPPHVDNDTVRQIHIYFDVLYFIASAIIIAFQARLLCLEDESSQSASKFHYRVLESIPTQSNA